MQSELSEHLSYDDNGVKAELDIYSSDALRGIRRARLKEEAKAQAQSDADVDTFILRLLSYPDVCATVEGTIMTRDGDTVTIDWKHPLSFESYIPLPEPLLIRIEDAIYRLNPHWLPAPSPEEQKKAVTTSTRGSSASTIRRKGRKAKSRSRT